MPGVSKDEVKVTVDEKHNVLTLECTKEATSPDDIEVGSVVFHKQERFVGKSLRYEAINTSLL